MPLVGEAPVLAVSGGFPYKRRVVRKKFPCDEVTGQDLAWRDRGRTWETRPRMSVWFYCRCKHHANEQELDNNDHSGFL